MIDKNNDFVIKSKLTLTVKTHSKYNDRNRVAAKQTNKQTDSDTQKLTNIQEEKQKVILTQTHKQTYKRRHAQREIKQMKNETLYSIAIEIGK